MNPSNFTIFPSDSVLRNYESEKIAHNIMVILARTGNTFRDLTWWEYRAERQADGHFTESERIYFDRVIGYCHSQETAILFSSVWAEVSNENNR